MLSATDLHGSYPAVITPMTSTRDGIAIDWRAFERLVDAVLEAGSHGVVIAGTTGQSATVTADEQVELVRRGVAVASRFAESHGRAVQIIASAGSNATGAAIDLSRRILVEGGAHALLHVTGYYNNPPQEGLIAHFNACADEAGRHGATVVLYNVPSRTGCNISAATCIELARHPAIIGVKEASGDLDQVQAILDGTDRSSFSVVSGEDHLVAELIRRGGTGVISAAANVWPREFQVLCDLARAGHHGQAAELQAALLPCVRAVFAAKNPIPLHAMLGGPLRLPLVGVDALAEPNRGRVASLIAAAREITEFPHSGAHAPIRIH